MARPLSISLSASLNFEIRRLSMISLISLEWTESSASTHSVLDSLKGSTDLLIVTFLLYIYP